MQRGNFIAIEGIDGAGKRTQIDMLADWLGRAGIAFSRMSFPRYESFFGRLVARFLNGDFGPLEKVDAHFSALLYAGDRLEAKAEIDDVLRRQRDGVREVRAVRPCHLVTLSPCQQSSPGTRLPPAGAGAPARG